MCGIGGCLFPAGETPDSGALEGMVAALGHRGPDGQGVQIIGSAGLAHTRLAIVDPRPSGRQPMESHDRRWWVTYNGEIFNHLQLRDELPGPFTGGTDTETLLELLAAHGIDGIERCNGLFAFAAVDTRRERGYLVRDRFGVKPLYYRRQGKALWFASEIRALGAAGLELELDPAMLRLNLGSGWLHGEKTIFSDVRRLPPGTILEFDLRDGSHRMWRWYDPAEAVEPDAAEELERMPRSALADTLEATLRRSVRRRLMSDVPLGTMCSGGLDSSLVAALAREEHPRIHAFNAAVVDQPEVDEGPWAERVSDALGIELHTARMTSATWRDGLVAAAIHNEHPLVHESSVPMAAIAALARSRGIRVLLSGEGADELFGGYEWLHGAEYRDFAAREKHLESAARGLYRAGQRGRHRARATRSQATIEETHTAAVTRRVTAAYSHKRGARRRLSAALLGDLDGYLPHLLNRQDKNTMQHSIETRVPFLDPEVVALALNTPLEARVEPTRKFLVREVGARHLPKEVTERPKVGFGFDIDRCIGERLNSGFLDDGLLRESLRLTATEWSEEVKPLSGQARMIYLTTEILARALVAGHSASAISGELWLNGDPGG